MNGLIESRAVHYVDGDGLHWAAWMVHVNGDWKASPPPTVNLFVPPRSSDGSSPADNGNWIIDGVSFSSRKHVGTWHWPERVEE